MLNVVNTNTADDLLHVPPEIKIQRCQVRRAWGATALRQHVNSLPSKTRIQPHLPVVKNTYHITSAHWLFSLRTHTALTFMAELLQGNTWTGWVIRHIQ
jgi:hypothetical protein